MEAQTQIGIETFKIVTKAIAQSDNLDDMSHHLAQLLVASLEIKGCALFILNPETQDLEVLASFGLSTKYLTKGPLSAPKSITEAFKERKAVIIPDIDKDNTLQYPAAAKEEGIKAIVSIPVAFSNETIGVLRLYHEATWEVSGHDLDSLNVLADQIGLAMTYSRLLNAVKAISEIVASTLTYELNG